MEGVVERYTVEHQIIFELDLWAKHTQFFLLLNTGVAKGQRFWTPHAKKDKPELELTTWKQK